MAYINTNEILGLTSPYASGNKDEPSSELDKMDFLTLLVTQLQNQDPLNPMEDTEFTSQLAEFSSLEQLTGIKDGVDLLNEGGGDQEMINATSFIGMDVVARGDAISKSGSEISTLYFSLDDSTASGFVNIFDEAGGIVNTIQLGAMQPGDYQVEWDGTDYDGEPAPDGVYYVSMAAENHNGAPVLVETEVSGEVTGVENRDGVHYLRLADGRVVEFSSISEVVSNKNAPNQDQQQQPDPRQNQSQQQASAPADSTPDAPADSTEDTTFGDDALSAAESAVDALLGQAA